MKSEYVKLSWGERHYGDMNLLQSELEILNLVRNLRNYLKLRKEEIEMKVKLKVKVEEALNSIGKLESLLPKTEMMTLDKKGKTKEELTLSDEIEKIKSKLERLQRGT